VFSKKRLDTGTRLLIENMSLPGKGLILDLGCGYGAVGVTAARLNPSLNVIMTDVNARAVRLAQENITRNKVTNAEVRQGYLYEPVKGLKFNCVLSNPPVSAGLGTVIGLMEMLHKFYRQEVVCKSWLDLKSAGKSCLLLLNQLLGTARFLRGKVDIAC